MEDNPLEALLNQYRDEEGVPNFEEFFPMQEVLRANPDSLNQKIMELARSRQDVVRDAQLSQSDAIDNLIRQATAAAIPEIFGAVVGQPMNTGLRQIVQGAPDVMMAADERVRQASREAREAELTGEVEVQRNLLEADATNFKREQDVRKANAAQARSQFEAEYDALANIEDLRRQAIADGREEEAHKYEIESEKALARARRAQAAAAEAKLKEEQVNKTPVQRYATNLNALQAQNQAIAELEEAAPSGLASSAEFSDLVTARQNTLAQMRTNVGLLEDDDFDQALKNALQTGDSHIVNVALGEARQRDYNPEVINHLGEVATLNKENLNVALGAAKRDLNMNRAKAIAHVMIARGFSTREQINEFMRLGVPSITTPSQ